MSSITFPSGATLILDAGLITQRIEPDPFDQFPGFTVTRGGYMREGAAMHSAQGPLQRLAAESDPLHGSAHLKV